LATLPPDHPRRHSPRRARTPARPPSARDVALVERYLRLRGTRLARGTAQEYRGDLMHFAGSLARQRSLPTASPDDVAAWFHAHTRDDDDPTDPRRWSVRTAHRRRDTLMGFFRWAARERLIRRNPVESVELPRFYRRPPRLVSLADIERIFSYAETRLAVADPRERVLLTLDVAVLRLMERLALRVSEAASIRLSRLSTVDGELRAWIAKKGNKPAAYPITGIVGETFVRWLKLRSTVVPAPGHEDFVFLHLRSGRRITRNQIWARLRILARAASLDDRVLQALSPHKLRHARARAMLAAGYHIAAVQSVLDHASIRTTQIYVEDAELTRLDTLRALSADS